MKKILFKKIGFFLSQDGGSVIILTAFLMIVVLGFAGLAVDIGVWYSQKRTLQMAADAGATGGSFALAKTGSSTLTSYVQHDLAKNGCTSATMQCDHS
jgi:uncharacterized membrane protein